MTLTKTPITYIIAKIPIVIISILIFIRDYNSLIDYFELTGNNNSINDYLKIIFTTSTFRTSFLMLIPLTGVFLKTKIGWLLMLSFYYLIPTILAYTLIGEKIERDGSIVIVFLIFIIPILFIGIMNNKENTGLAYNIKRSELLKMNITSFTIALIVFLIILVLNLTQ